MIHHRAHRERREEERENLTTKRDEKRKRDAHGTYPE